MEITTNSSFQKPVIYQKVGEKKQLKKSIVASVEVKLQTGCAIPKLRCPLGINDVMTLPHQVETDQASVEM
jgi:translation initiation factor RLI1